MPETPREVDLPHPFMSAEVFSDLNSLPPGVRMTRLDNGLVIIVRTDHSAPVVSAQAWCQTGSIHEGRWLGAGLSHCLEHMLFKGTTTRGPGRIDQEIQAVGGDINAYTSFDRTVYYINVPNNGARVAVDILCDVVQNATLPPDELEKEKQVILREMDMAQDDPGQRSSRRLFEVAYTRSPYRFTIIGYPDIFKLFTPADLRAYYHERYVPNNLFLVVVGDVRAEDIEAQIRDAFARLPQRALPPDVLPDEPKQIAPRVVVEDAPIEVGHAHFAWHIPDLRHPDVPVLDVLATLLGQGRSSRLYRRVREEQGLVHEVDAWTYNPGAPGLLGVSALVEGRSFEAARDAVLAEIEQMKSRPITKAELNKAVKQFMAGYLAIRKTMAGQAQDLGAGWLAAGDLNFSRRYLAAVERVLPEDVQRVAQTYLTTENLTLYALLPQGTRPAVAAVAESTRDQPIQKIVLPNGLRLLLKEDHRLPFVEFRAVFRGGVLAETAETNGITHLLARMLLQGTTCRTAETIAEQIESVGGSVDTFGGNNSFGVNVEVLRDDMALGLDLLTDLLRNPSFPAPGLEREREVQLAHLRAQKDDLLRRTALLMRRTLFGEWGYGLDSLGREEVVRWLTADDLRAFHQRLTAPGNCVLAIYGDINPEQVRAEVEQGLGQWGSESEPISAPAPPPPGGTSRRAVDTADKQQAVLVIGYPGPTLFSPDRFALELIQEACSDLGSRLFLRIREKLGLAYYVGAIHFPGLIPGFFAFYAGTAPATAGQVETEMLREAELLRTEGLSAEELARAKAKVLGQRKIARQNLGQLAQMTALDELFGLGFDHYQAEDTAYEAVTLEDIRAAARKYLQPDAAVIAVVQPPTPGA